VLRLTHMLAQRWIDLHERLLMQAKEIIFAAITVMAALSPAGHPLDEGESLHGQLTTLNHALRHMEGLQRTERIKKHYQSLMAGRDPCSLANDEKSLDDIFKATALVQLYSLSESHANTLGCLYQKLLRSETVSTWHTITYAGALVSIARFDDANRLLEEIKDRQTSPLPVIKQAPADANRDSWRLLSLKNADEASVSQWTSAPEHLQVVAVVHPSCGPSARAMAGITTRSDLAWLRGRLTLLVPPDSTLPASGILEWNRANPDLPMHRMYTRDDWAALASLDTPTFYLMQGTQVIERFEGWPNDAGLQRLQAALAH
jgi:hypothetical protein